MKGDLVMSREIIKFACFLRKSMICETERVSDLHRLFDKSIQSIYNNKLKSLNHHASFN